MGCHAAEDGRVGPKRLHDGGGLPGPAAKPLGGPVEAVAGMRWRTLIDVAGAA